MERYRRTSIITRCAVFCIAAAVCTGHLFAAGGAQVCSIVVGDLKREYTIYLPTAYDGEKSLPVVIMFHGGGGTSKAAMAETGWDKKAEKEGFIAVFPQATAPDPTRPASFRGNSAIWNDGSMRFHAGKDGVDDIAYVNAVIDELLSKFKADPKRICATGFSNGASMTFRTGLELSRRIAAIAPMSGALWITNAPIAEPISLLYIHGTADPMNPINGGVPTSAGGIKMGEGKAKPPVKDHIARWAALIECQPSPISTESVNGVTTRKYAQGKGGTAIEWITIDDLGHTWPGGKSLLPASIVGNMTDKMIAVDVIWDYFKRHVKP
ncbi:MAG: PHB depolymerase family esterase [Spirochaetota bacterium]